MGGRRETENFPVSVRVDDTRETAVYCHCEKYIRVSHFVGAIAWLVTAIKNTGTTGNCSSCYIQP